MKINPQIFSIFVAILTVAGTIAGVAFFFGGLTTDVKSTKEDIKEINEKLEELVRGRDKISNEIEKGILKIDIKIENGISKIDKKTKKSISSLDSVFMNKGGISMDAPKNLVVSFINDLGSQRFRSAFDKTKNPIWPSYKHFSSTQAYGGITSTEIYNSSLILNDGKNAQVFIHYYAKDPANKSRSYKQDFYLKRINGNWKIIRAQLASD